MKTKDRKIIYILLSFFIILVVILNIINEKNTLKQEVTKNIKEATLVNTQNENYENEIQEENILKEEKTKKTENTILTTYQGYPVIAKLKIQKINLETYVISEYSKQALGVSVTKFYGGNPNEVGNFCIAGHNYVTKNMFHDLKKLSIGDTFILTDVDNEYQYKIYLIETVNPNETQCLSQQTNGKVEVTLITCTTDSSKRIIVKAVKI